MKNRFGILAAIVIAALLALGLSACGESSDEETSADRAGTTNEMAHMGIDHGAMGDPSISTPAADLRVTLDRLLGEHAFLAAMAMQKGYDGDKDFEAVATALDANTVELGDAVGSVYGDEAREGFLKLWRDHIGFFVEYTVASAEKDEAAKEQAIVKLDGYRVAFGTFLAGANPNIDADEIAMGLQSHVNQLATALDTYASGDYAMAYEQLREAYGHMFGTGDALAGAIVAQYPEKFATK